MDTKKNTLDKNGSVFCKKEFLTDLLEFFKWVSILGDPTGIGTDKITGSKAGNKTYFHTGEEVIAEI